MPYEDYQEYQRDMADEAKQAAWENAIKPLPGNKRVWTNHINDRVREHYDPLSGETWTEVDRD